MPAYPTTGALAVGHLAKVYSENNVYVLAGYMGDPEPSAANVVQTAHKAPPTTGDTPDVGQQTYFFDKGSTLNGKAVDLMASVKEQVMSSGAPEVLSTADVWKPTDTYKYTASTAANTKADTGTSGANKLAISAP